MTKLREDIRNVAIIAHVDHGKTTLVDELLKQSHTLDERKELDERAMDSNDLEKERGITILAKNTAVAYNGTRINIMDTPGHADFGGEVERIMKMVDGVVLVVDAYEGTMPQTRFVLKKALEQNLTPIVVVNKIDKPSARPEEVVDEVLELFIELGADDDQLEFPVVYASAINGTSSLSDNPAEQEHTMAPIFDTIIDHIPAPVDNSDEPLQFQVSLLDYNDFVGRIGIGRIFRGTVKVGDQVTLSKLDGTTKNFRVTKLFGFFGLERREIEEAKAGDLIAISGMEDIFVGETITPTDAVEPLPVLRIDEPTLQMTFLANNSPFAGREGKHVTSRKVEERLLAELQTDVSLRVDPTDSPDKWTVSGRGELHLSILIETMRRQNYEFQVSRPQVITKMIDGKLHEPMEFLIIEVPDTYVGPVMEKLGSRKGELINMGTREGGVTHIEFRIPSRGLMGYRPEFLTDTNGNGIMNHVFDGYEPYKGEIVTRHQGSLIAFETGETVTYGLYAAQERGRLFIGPGVPVYEGMIVGASPKSEDITVNVCKKKHITNTRASGSDDALKLTPPTIMSLEQCLEFIADDELVEVTPENIRMRKRILSKEQRMKQAFRKK